MNRDTAKLFRLLMNDIKVELFEEFIRNFERKAFFDTAWKSAKHNNIGSLLMRNGSLRRSLSARVFGNTVVFSSSLPYATAHNEGAKITVTQKMRGFFWYQHKLSLGQMQSTSKGKLRNNKFNRAMSAEAVFWKSMALKPVGSVIEIPKRQFIGDHPRVQQSVNDCYDDWMRDDVNKYILDNLNNMIN